MRASEPVRHFTNLVNAVPLDLLTGGAGLAPSRDDHALHAQGFQLGVDLGLAVAPVGGHRRSAPARSGRRCGRWPAPASGRRAGCRSRRRGRGRRRRRCRRPGPCSRTRPACRGGPWRWAGRRGRAGDHPRRAVGHAAAEAEPGLGRDAFDQVRGALQLGHERGRPSRCRHSLAAQASAGVEGDVAGIGDAASAMLAISPVMAFTSSLASSLRRRSQAAMACARRRTDRVRSGRWCGWPGRRP